MDVGHLTDVVSAPAGGGAPHPGALEHGHLPAPGRVVVVIVQTVRAQVTDLQALSGGGQVGVNTRRAVVNSR